MTTRLYVVAGKATDSVTHGFLPAAAALGLDVVILTDRPGDHRRVCDAEIVECDVTDFRALIDRVTAAPAERESGRVAVFSNSDHLQAPTALAAAYHGLPGKDWRAATRTKNKALMRRHLADAGLDTVFCRPVDGSAGVWLDRPMVLKPRDGVASEDVHLVRDDAELTARVAEIRTRRSDPLIVEEFLPGRLHTLETLGDGHELRILGSFQTTLSAPPHFVEERLDWAPPPPESGQVLAQLAALGVGFGACHTEFVVHEGRARLIEVNYRVIGDHCDLLLADLIGLPIFEYILRVHLGEPLSGLAGIGGLAGPEAGAGVPTTGAAVARTAVVDYVIADRSGRLTELAPGPVELIENGVRLTYRPQRAPGDSITRTRTNRDYLGTIRAIGEAPAAVEEAVRRFRAGRTWEIR